MTARFFATVLLVNTLAGVIPALFLLYSDVAPPSTMIISSLVFSYCIGTLIFAVMHFAHRFFNRLPNGLRWTAEMATFLVLGTIGAMLALNILIATHVIPRAAYDWVLSQIVWKAVAFTAVTGAVVSYVLNQSVKLRSTTLEMRTRQLEEERARKLATEARLSSLESRVHPHFLFNTLNSIAALIREDPRRAEKTVERLAGLLRYSLDTNTRPLVPLSQELRIVQDYLDIEKTRLGERLRFSIDVPGYLEDAELPPLALQTLVENSIKHAVAPDRNGGEIRIRARLEGSLAILEVIDDGPGFDAAAAPQGHGLDNLRERLNALFEGTGRMDVGRREDRTVVSLFVPQKKVHA